MQIRTTSSPLSTTPFKPQTGSVAPSPSENQVPSESVTFVEPPPPGYNPGSPQTLKTSLIIGAGALGVAAGVYSGVASGVAPALVGGVAGAAVGGVAGGSIGLFADLSNMMSLNRSNWTNTLGGLGLVGGAAVGATVGGLASNPFVGALAGAAVGVSSALAAAVVAKEMVE